MTHGMYYRRLGRSGLLVSPICLGAMMFGGPTDESEAKRIIDDAADAGVNFIDTADTYAESRSEEVVGRAVAADRDRWVLATKVGNPVGDGPNSHGLSRKWITEELEKSLRRLGTDYIDILYLHKEDHGTPFEETVRAIADLQRAGKLRYFGVSNHRAWRIARICGLCDSAGIDRPVACQPLYHALNRAVEIEVLPACGFFGVGVVAYSPLARGVLSGKYAPGEPAPADSRAGRRDTRMLQTEFRPENLAAADRVTDYARKRGADPAAFAIAWILANPLVTGVVAGPRTFDQWRSYVAALDVQISPEDEIAIDAAVPRGGSAIPNFVDQAYPVEGRPARHARDRG